MGKALTEDLIKQKTKSDSLHLIRNLNLWGQEIDDLKALKGMPNLEVLSLSVNKIATLRDISYCHKLKELYLRKNAISDISEIRFLSNLSDLRVLWLSDNPCAGVANYREIVIKTLPFLEKLDNIAITDEDKQNTENLRIDFLENQSNHRAEQQQSSRVNRQATQQNYYDNDQDQQQPQQQQNYGYQSTVVQSRNAPNGFAQQQQQQPIQQQQQLSRHNSSSSNGYGHANNNNNNNNGHQNYSNYEIEQQKVMNFQLKNSSTE